MPKYFSTPSPSSSLQSHFPAAKLSGDQHPSSRSPGRDFPSPSAVLFDPISLLAQPLSQFPEQGRTGFKSSNARSPPPPPVSHPSLQQRFQSCVCLGFWPKRPRSQYRTVMHTLSHSGSKPIQVLFTPLLDCQFTGPSTVSYLHMDPGLWTPEEHSE